MSKLFRKSVSFLVAMVLVVSFMASAIGVQKTSDKASIPSEPIILSDPFAQMYDSDEVFIEQAEYILERAMMENAALNEDVQTAKSTGAFSIAEATLSREVAGALQSTGKISAEDYTFTEMDVRELEHLYEDSRVDRIFS